jgi:methyl-accepting chemotaxis protein
MRSSSAHRSPASRLADLGVRTQILAAVATAAAVATGVGLLGISSLAKTSADTTAMYAQSFVSLEDAATLRHTMLELRVNVMSTAIATDNAEIDTLQTAITANEQELRDTIAKYQATSLTADQRAALDTFSADLNQYTGLTNDTFLPAARAHHLVAFVTARDASKPLIDSMGTATDTLVAGEESEAKAAAAAAAQSYRSNRTLVIVVLLAGLALALGLGLAVARSIVAGMARVRAVAEALANGDLTVTAGVRSRNEVGRTGQALDDAVAHLRTAVGTIDGSASSLAAAAEEMSASSAQISSAAEETATQAGMVSAAAEQVSRSIQGVAAGSEQMGASIGEISRNAADAAKVAAQAVASAGRAGATVNQLGDSSREIGNVVKLITSIAEQTNLLALNATIEAARAGAAGKGFAVVAGEVKELAQETAKATGDIAGRVEAIQADTESAVAAIEEIATVIASINDYQLTIASAVEQQTATTAEVNRSVSEAATGSGEIAANILGVAGAADQTTRGATQSEQAATELAQMSAELTALVGAFTR